MRTRLFNEMELCRVAAMPNRQVHTQLVADFIARGGVIHRLAESKPTVAEDVLTYLRAQNVDVHAVVEPGERVSKYLFKDRIITLKQLVAIANRRRSRRRLPPFELPSDLH
jgi:hypothetical protein